MTDQITAVSAEERLESIKDHAVASGAVKRWFAVSHQRRLERAIRWEKRPATAADLKAAGIEVIRG